MTANEGFSPRVTAPGPSGGGGKHSPSLSADMEPRLISLGPQCRHNHKTVIPRPDAVNVPLKISGASPRLHTEREQRPTN